MSSALVISIGDIIISYWDNYEEKAKELFEYRIKSSLLPEMFSVANKTKFIEALSEKAHYLI
ncbi:MAG: hypothetical protein GQ531_01270 [Sulfurovum sp.]|nr:hypothetical protein [Sulfurovum sp.]